MTEAELNKLTSLGLKYDKRQKKEMLAARDATPPQEHEIKTFEEAIGYSLPNCYREFLIRHNGGVPSRSQVDVDGQGERVVRNLYSLVSPARRYPIRHLLEMYEKRIPVAMLPVGDDPAGNLFLLELSQGETYGRVYFWDHEQEAETESQPYFDNISFVAESFASFLDRLR
jgi:cell wall assembly regulator SMI1